MSCASSASSATLPSFAFFAFFASFARGKEAYRHGLGRPRGTWSNHEINHAPKSFPTFPTLPFPSFPRSLFPSFPLSLLPIRPEGSSLHLSFTMQHHSFRSAAASGRRPQNLTFPIPDSRWRRLLIFATWLPGPPSCFMPSCLHAGCMHLPRGLHSIIYAVYPSSSSSPSSPTSPISHSFFLPHSPMPRFMNIPTCHPGPRLHCYSSL